MFKKYVSSPIKLKQKNGFTLIELAIVLVVIGLLLGMAFKGKSLVDASRLKADINKISKIETAINTYLATYGRNPGVRDDGNITETKIFQDLYDSKTLKPSDRKVSYFNGYYRIAPCKETTDSGFTTWTTEQTFTSTSPLCLLIDTSTSATSDNPNTNFDNKYVTAEWACYVESLFDDKNYYAGNGRRLLKMADSDTIALSNCSSMRNTGSAFRYYYRIF